MGRRDGTPVKNLDSMHVMFPYITGGRADNEAVINETLDMTQVEKYIEEKNQTAPDFKYTFFHVICAAAMKTMVLRPKLNRFYAYDNRLYQRNVFTISFVVKKQFVDSSEEGVATVTIDPKSDISPVEQIHSQVEKYCNHVRKEGSNDGATDILDSMNKLPPFLISLLFWFLKVLDRFGLYPKSLMENDPYYSSVFITNLGSIKMNANYHHLSNWGTNSFFVVVGEKTPKLFVNKDGSTAIKDAIDLGITLDERIADGYYYSKAVRIMKKLIENPWLLDGPVSEEVEL